MRLLIATGLYPPESGGPATHTKLLEDMLLQRGIEVDVVPFRIVRFLPPLIRHLVYAWHLFRRARGADALLAQDTVSVGLPAALVSRITRIPLIVRVPGDYAWEQGTQRFGVKDTLDEFQKRRYGWRVGFLRALQRFAVRSAKRVIVPSAYMKRIVNGWTDARKVSLIYSSVDLSAPVPYVPLPSSERPEGFLLITVARLVPWKGIDGILRVVAKEPKWNLIVVGDGPERSTLETLATELGINKQVRFTGSLPRLQTLSWIMSADIFVLNSTYEGLSHVLIEAMWLTTPVIATNIGGNPEVVEDGVSGILIPPKDDKALHAAIKRIETNPDEAKNLGARGLERAHNFSSLRAINEFVQLLETL